MSRNLVPLPYKGTVHPDGSLEIEKRPHGSARARARCRRSGKRLITAGAGGGEGKIRSVTAAQLIRNLGEIAIPLARSFSTVIKSGGWTVE